MNKYDVGLVSMWYGINYGSILTAFALYKTIESLGYKTLMINKPKELWNDVFYDNTTIANVFARKYFLPSRIRNYYEENYELNEICKQFVVGCDTLWHYPLVRSAYKFFFLDFVHAEKNKISYASSFGAGLNAPQNIKIDIAKSIHRLNYVSVREKKAVEFLQKELETEAVQVLDPVFLLDNKVYSDLSAEKDAQLQDKEYIFAYILDPSPQKLKIANELACRKDRNVKLVLDPMNYSKIKQKLDGEMEKYEKIQIQEKLTVERWLYLIEKSSETITDSYHGLCFSLIFNKNFLCMINRLRGADRFTSIMELLDIKDGIIQVEENNSENDYEVPEQNWELVKTKLQKLKHKSIDWLSASLKNKNHLQTSPIEEFKDLRKRIEKIELYIRSNNA